MINLSVQQVLSLWAHGTVLRNLTGNGRGPGCGGTGMRYRPSPPPLSTLVGRGEEGVTKEGRPPGGSLTCSPARGHLAAGTWAQLAWAPSTRAPAARPFS